jgi:hypothetical protein
VRALAPTVVRLISAFHGSVVAPARGAPAERGAQKLECRLRGGTASKGNCEL